MARLALLAGVAPEKDGHWSCLIVQADTSLPDGYDFVFGGGGRSQADACKLAMSVMRQGAGGLYVASPRGACRADWQEVSLEQMQAVTFPDGPRCNGWHVVVAGYRLYIASVRASLAPSEPHLDSPLF